MACFFPLVRQWPLSTYCKFALRCAMCLAPPLPRLSHPTCMPACQMGMHVHNCWMRPQKDQSPSKHLKFLPGVAFRASAMPSHLPDLLTKVLSVCKADVQGNASQSRACQTKQENVCPWPNITKCSGCFQGCEQGGSRIHSSLCAGSTQSTAVT